MGPHTADTRTKQRSRYTPPAGRHHTTAWRQTQAPSSALLSLTTSPQAQRTALEFDRERSQAQLLLSNIARDIADLLGPDAALPAASGAATSSPGLHYCSRLCLTPTLPSSPASRTQA